MQKFILVLGNSGNINDFRNDLGKEGVHVRDVQLLMLHYPRKKEKKIKSFLGNKFKEKINQFFYRLFGWTSIARNNMNGTLSHKHGVWVVPVKNIKDRVFKDGSEEL